MSMLKKPQRQAFAKVGLYGDAGSGKTRTAAEIAIGLHKWAKLAKPVAMFDTEPAAAYIEPLFKKAGIEFVVADHSRALVDLMGFMDEAEATCSIAIIDSITHIWRDAQDSFLRKLNETREANNKRPLASLEFQHWKPIKERWGQFTDRFLASHLHVIVCGRSGSVYEYQDKDDGSTKKELITVGTKMATEKELGYEPSLLIEMYKAREDGKIINTAVVEKDRADTLNGREFAMPTFESFLPHFQFLNIGGEAHPSMAQRDSKELFSGDGEDDWGREKRSREIWCEEIKGLLVEHGMDGTSTEAKKRRQDVLMLTFGTGSWTKVESMDAERIKAGYHTMKSELHKEGAKA